MPAMSLVVDIRPTAPAARPEDWLAVVAALADELAATAPGDRAALRRRLLSLMDYELADHIGDAPEPGARNALVTRLVARLDRHR